MSNPTESALDAIRATCTDYDAAMREQARELGQRRMQVELLREALAQYGAHASYCRTIQGWVIGGDCTCGLADALRIGAPEPPEAL